jgi:mRNA interferase MazF
MVKSYTPRQGDVIFMNFDPQAGFEQHGRRPALVISNNIFNRHCKMTLVCPITNTDKNHAFHVRLGDSMKTTGVVLCDQVRALDANARNAVFVEDAPKDILEEVVDLVSSFL